MTPSSSQAFSRGRPTGSSTKAETSCAAAGTACSLRIAEGVAPGLPKVWHYSKGQSDVGAASAWEEQRLEVRSCLRLRLNLLAHGLMRDCTIWKGISTAGAVLTTSSAVTGIRLCLRAGVADSVCGQGPQSRFMAVLPQPRRDSINVGSHTCTAEPRSGVASQLSKGQARHRVTHHI